MLLTKVTNRVELKAFREMAKVNQIVLPELKYIIKSPMEIRPFRAFMPISSIVIRRRGRSCWTAWISGISYMRNMLSFLPLSFRIFSSLHLRRVRM